MKFSLVFIFVEYKRIENKTKKQKKYDITKCKVNNCFPRCIASCICLQKWNCKYKLLFNSMENTRWKRAHTYVEHHAQLLFNQSAQVLNKTICAHVVTQTGKKPMQQKQLVEWLEIKKSLSEIIMNYNCCPIMINVNKSG